MVRTRVLITGHAKSGTRFMAKQFQEIGLVSYHEKAFTALRHSWYPNQQVESSWLAAPYTIRHDAYIIHLVRNPIKVIRSQVFSRQEWDELGLTGKEERERDGFARFQVGVIKEKDPIKRASIFWLRWNDLIKADRILRIEDVTPEVINEIGAMLGAEIFLDKLSSKEGEHKTEWRNLEWSEIMVPGMKEKVKEYGYE